MPSQAQKLHIKLINENVNKKIIGKVNGKNKTLPSINAQHNKNVRKECFIRELPNKNAFLKIVFNGKSIFTIIGYIYTYEIPNITIITNKAEIIILKINPSERIQNANDHHIMKIIISAKIPLTKEDFQFFLNASLKS